MSNLFVSYHKCSVIFTNPCWGVSPRIDRGETLVYLETGRTVNPPLLSRCATEWLKSPKESPKAQDGVVERDEDQYPPARWFTYVAGRKIVFPVILLVSSSPTVSFIIVYSLSQLSINSFHSSAVGILHFPPRLTRTTSSSGSNWVLLSTTP